MTKNWWYLSLRILPLLLLALLVAHPALAKPHPDIDAVDGPEFDLRLAIEGLAVAGATAAVIWERVRRRR
jgi:hypothetical protein